VAAKAAVVRLARLVISQESRLFENGNIDVDEPVKRFQVRFIP
jgi:hypothetical protein